MLGDLTLKEIKIESIPPTFETFKIEKVREILGNEELRYISSYIDMNLESTKILMPTSQLLVYNLWPFNYSNLVTIGRINDIRYLSKFFKSVNNVIPAGGMYAGFAETDKQRAIRILNKYPKVFSYPYYTLDFILKRIFPKWKFTKKIYFYLTHGKNRVLSEAEIYGRLASCGYKIVDHREINNLLFFIVKKISTPLKIKRPTYGSFIRLKRVGKNGKPIKIYKLRTMHPYAEYLQSYMYNKNNLAKSGKFNNDFRVTNWGKVLRKYWLDELPMLYNWLKRELKLVGIRPLSQQYLNLYSKEIIEQRIKYKPGLIPPYYADMPKNFEDIMESEKKYLEAYEKNPILTDLKYLFKVMFNIVFKGARSS